MRTETREVYISDDDKVFDNLNACQDHERQIIENKRRIINLRVYVVSSSFDTTEGRKYFNTTYIITDANYAVVLEYCFDTFGSPLSKWYNNSYYENWIIHQAPMNADEALSRAEKNRSDCTVVFISDAPIDHPQLPKPIFPWPKKTIKEVHHD